MKNILCFIVLVSLASVLSLHALDANLLPDSADDFLCCRSSIQKCAEGYTGLMSANRWAELIWVPPEDTFDGFILDIKTINPPEAGLNTWVIKIIDADDEVFWLPDNQRVNVNTTVEGRELTFLFSEFQYKDKRKVDGIITFPLKRIYLLYYPRPSLPGKALGFVLKSCTAIFPEQKQK